jgi:hypothetical protein
MVFEHRGEHASAWAAISSIASKIGDAAQTLRGRVRQAERNQGVRAGPTTAPIPTRWCASTRATPPTGSWSPSLGALRYLIITS